MKSRAILIFSTFLFSWAPAFAQSNPPITVSIANSDNQTLSIRVVDQLTPGPSAKTFQLSQGSSQSLNIASDQNGQGAVQRVAQQSVRDADAGSLKCAQRLVQQLANNQQVSVRLDYGSSCGCPC
jgi:hypothetical protein